MTLVSVPRHRRSDFNTQLVIAGIFLPPCLWWVCYNSLTGNIYQPPYQRESLKTQVQTWGWGRKLLILAVSLCQIPATALLFLR